MLYSLACQCSVSKIRAPLTIEVFVEVIYDEWTIVDQCYKIDIFTQHCCSQQVVVFCEIQIFSSSFNSPTSIYHLDNNLLQLDYYRISHKSQ